MKYKQLGKKGVQVSSIGQGTMGVGGYFTTDNSNDGFYIEMIKRGIEHGMILIDTAEAYGAGHSEELIGSAIKNCRNDIFLATKVSPEHLSYQDVLKSAEKSLQRLQTDYLDLYQVHWPNPTIALEETLEAMKKLVQEGKVKYIGVSNFSLNQLKQANKLFGGQITSLQVEYNLFDRTIEKDILPYCEEQDILIIAYSPLDQGKIFNDKNKAPLWQRIANRYNRTPVQIALAWLISKKPVVAIPKATKINHIIDNASAADFDLSLEDIELINKTFQYPVVEIPIEQIKVNKDGLDKFVPGPKDLAQDIQMGDTIKPVRVVKTQDTSGKYLYNLVEGKLRYWAWVIATDGKIPIPTLVR